MERIYDVRNKISNIKQCAQTTQHSVQIVYLKNIGDLPYEPVSKVDEVHRELSLDNLLQLVTADAVAATEISLPFC